MMVAESMGLLARGASVICWQKGCSAQNEHVEDKTTFEQPSMVRVKIHGQFPIGEEKGS
jgi:hypothetical protein